MSVTHKVVVSPADYTTVPYTPSVEETRTEYVGATLEVGSESVQIMSDVWETARYALVWDAEAQKPKKIVWVDHAVADATPEIKETFRAYHIELEFKKRINQLEAEALVPVRGDKVKVVRGRKNLGLEGEATALTTFANRYTYSRTNVTKVAIPLDDVHEEIRMRNGNTWKKYTNVVWIDIGNVDRVVPRPIDYAEVAKAATDYVEYQYRRILKD